MIPTDRFRRRLAKVEASEREFKERFLAGVELVEEACARGHRFDLSHDRDRRLVEILAAWDDRTDGQLAKALPATLAAARAALDEVSNETERENREPRIGQIRTENRPPPRIG